MKKIVSKKLFRDRIPEIIAASRKECTVEILSETNIILIVDVHF